MSVAERKAAQRSRQAEALATINSTLRELIDYVESIDLGKQRRDQVLNSLALIAANLERLGKPT